MTLNRHSTHRAQHHPPLMRMSFIDDRAPGEWLDDEVDTFDDCEVCANDDSPRTRSRSLRRNSAALLPSHVLRRAGNAITSTDRAARRRLRVPDRSRC